MLLGKNGPGQESQDLCCCYKGCIMVGLPVHRPQLRLRERIHFSWIGQKTMEKQIRMGISDALPVPSIASTHAQYSRPKKGERDTDRPRARQASSSYMSPPRDPETVIPLGSDDHSYTQIKSVCIRLLPGWSSLSPSDIELSVISGGITNLLLKVSPASQHGLAPVAIKVFGYKTELLIDRDRELEALIHLNHCGFGAKVLASFCNGRIEEFLVARALEPVEMGSATYVPRIAQTLRRLHAVPTDGKPTLWPTILRWFEMACQLSFDDPVKQELFSKVDLDAMRAEIEATRSICDKVDSPVVFSHNDLLSGNILIVQDQGGQGEQMQLIDYEYSACGFRGFDLGNHFNEYAGFECDYSRFPSSEQQRLFFKHYLGESTTDTEHLEPELERLEAESNLFALASHIYWGVWALIQARYSPIDFDYLGYSATRWKEYHLRKAEFVAQAQKVLLRNRGKQRRRCVIS